MRASRARTTRYRFLRNRINDMFYNGARYRNQVKKDIVENKKYLTKKQQEKIMKEYEDENQYIV